MEPQPTVPPPPFAPVMPIAPAPVVSPSHPKWPWILGGVALLVVGGVAGVFLGKYLAYSTPAPVTAVPTITSDQTANWKTYDKNGYYFKYPDSWFLLESQVLGKGIYAVLNPTEVTSFAPDGLSGPIYIFLHDCNESNSPDGSCDKPFETQVMEYKDQFTPETVKVTPSVLIDSVSGTQISGILTPSPAGEDKYSKVTTAQIGKNSLAITVYGKEFETVYDQILSTFKFTN